MELLTNVIVEVAEALGGSFKLVTPAPKPVREMPQLLRDVRWNAEQAGKVYIEDYRY